MNKKHVRHRCVRRRHTQPQEETQTAPVSLYPRKQIKSENGSVHIKLTHQSPAVIHPLTPKMDGSAKGSSPRSKIVHLGGGVEEDDRVVRSVMTAPRTPEAMFFPDLKDSSLKAEAVERARREAELQRHLQGLKRPLEDRHICNAAILPDLRDPPALNLLDAQEMNLISGHAYPEGSMGIHNRTVEEYQQIFNSVVDPVRRSTPGRSLALGRNNKVRLWEALGDPSLHWANIGQAGQLQVWESYDVTALHSEVHIDLDTSLEPDSPPQPWRKRARH